MNKTDEVHLICPKLTMSHTTNPSHFNFNTGIIVCVMNGVLSVPTTILNVLLILSILTTPNLRRPSYILICALAFTDLGVGILVQPLYIARKITFMMSDYETYCILLQVGNVFAHVCCSPSFFIVTAISVDRYLAIHLKTSYNAVVTIKTVLLFMVFALLCAGCITVVRFRSTSPKYMSIAAALMCIVLAVILFCYFKSLKVLRTVQMHLTSEEFKENNPRSGVANHHHVLTTLMVIVTTLFCCYVPFVAVVIAMAIHGRSQEFMVAWEIGLTLLYLNSLLNPVVHFARLHELREACAVVVKRG